MIFLKYIIMYYYYIWDNEALERKNQFFWFTVKQLDFFNMAAVDLIKQFINIV